MSEAFDRWNAERKLPEKTLAEFRRFHAAFRKMHGDLAIAEVTRKHIVAFKDALIVDGKAPKTVIKQVSALRAMLEWAFHNDHIQSNPASRIKIAAPKVRKEKRLPYDAADLKRIFSSSIYTEGLRPRAGGGEAAYWLPLLALFTGARVEELAQALPGDIREEDGVPVLDITDREEGKRVKTTSSRRRVPLHRELVRLGFLDYAEKMRAAKKVRLFPALVPDKWQACSGNFSKWWGRFARSKLGISDERKVFHSFRHSFKEACRACGINEEVHDALTGHSGGGVGRSYGGQNYPLVPLSAAIGCLQFKGIEVIQRLQKAAH